MQPCVLSDDKLFVIICRQQLISLLEDHFFPKWRAVLQHWLMHNPDYEEVTAWYLGWKVSSVFVHSLLRMLLSLNQGHQERLRYQRKHSRQVQRTAQTFLWGLGLAPGLRHRQTPQPGIA